MVLKYELNITDHNINADGYNRRAGGKVFNEMYPGPWIGEHHRSFTYILNITCL